MKYEPGTRVRIKSGAKDLLESVSVPGAFAGRSGAIHSHAGPQDGHASCWFVDFDEADKWYVPEESIELEVGTQVGPVFKSGMVFQLQDEDALSDAGLSDAESLVGVAVTVVSVVNAPSSICVECNGRKIYVPQRCLDVGPMAPGQPYTIKKDGVTIDSLASDSAPTVLAGEAVEYYGWNGKNALIRRATGATWWVSPGVFVVAAGGPVEFTSACHLISHRLSRSSTTIKSDLYREALSRWDELKDETSISRGTIPRNAAAFLLASSGPIRSLITTDQRNAFDAIVSAVMTKYEEAGKSNPNAVKLIRAMTKGEY